MIHLDRGFEIRADYTDLGGQNNRQELSPEGHACVEGNMLKKAGAKKIRGWTLFRTPSPDIKVLIA
jgi:hypothetical protein